MSDHIVKTIEELEHKLAEQVSAVVATKSLINQLCEMAKVPARYHDADLTAGSGPSLSIRSDQFYGQPQAACVREILEMRKALNKGPATVNEIYSALVEGGFAFDTKNDENAKRGLRISIAKNTALFHKLPNGKIGLKAWYPNAKSGKLKKDLDGPSNGDAELASNPVDDDSDEEQL